MRIDFDFTLEDHLAWLEDAAAFDRLIIQSARNASRSYWMIITFLIAVVVAITSVLIEVGRDEISFPLLALMLTLLVFSGWIAVAMTYSFRRMRGKAAIRAHVERMIKQGDYRTDFGPRSVELRDDAVVSATSAGLVTRFWSSVWRIEVTPRAVYIQLFPGWCLVVPSRAFTDDLHRREFVRLARRLHESASETQTKRVRDFVADRDVPCRACKYNLRGCDGAACPECGLRLDFQMVTGSLLAGRDPAAEHPVLSSVPYQK